MAEQWRTGRSVGRTVYIGDTLVGVMDSPSLAEQVVAAVNATAHLWELPAMDTVVTSVFADDQLANQGPRGVQVQHRPTGLTVRHDEHRSRLDNIQTAFAELRTLLLATIPSRTTTEGEPRG